MMWLWVMFALMAIGIVNTQLMAVFERMREFGLLQALGMRPRLVLYEVALESTSADRHRRRRSASHWRSRPCRPFPTASISAFWAAAPNWWARAAFSIRMSMSGDFALYSAIVWVLGVIATLWPARRASKVSPVEAMGRG